MDVSGAFKAALEDAVRTGPTRATTRSSVVKNALDEHRALILKAIAQGYSPTALAKKLKASGISASVESLRQSVQEIVQTTSGSSRAKPAKARQTKATTSHAPASRDSRDNESKVFEAEDRTA